MTTPAPRSGVHDRRLRFARVGRVIPIAVAQIAVTLAASRWSGGPVDGSGPPWAGRATPGAGAVDPVAIGPVALALLIAGVVVLPFRWRWPVVVLGVTLGTTIGYALLVTPRGPFVAALTMAIVNAWFRGGRVPVYVVAGVAQAVLPLVDTLAGRAPFPTVTQETLCLAWLTATIAITELVRVRVVRADERRRARAEAEQRRAGEERVRIARELHDSVAHSMSLINLQSGVALHLGHDLPEQTRESLTNIRDASRDALVELRTILGVLRSVDGETGASERNPVPGLDRLPELVARARAAGVDVDLHVQGDPTTVGGVVDRNGFRIVQEAITNVMKHAPDHVAHIDIAIGDDVVELAVRDEPSTRSGSGRPVAAPALGDTGNGIIGMRERATAVGGSLRAGPGPDGGWAVVARLPTGATPRAGADHDVDRAGADHDVDRAGADHDVDRPDGAHPHGLDDGAHTHDHDDHDPRRRTP